MNKLELPIEKIYTMYQNGISSEKIAKTYHRSPTFILNQLKQYCETCHLPLTFIKGGRKSLTFPMEEMYELYQDGIPVREIADLYDCSEKTIYNRLNQYCKENNLPLTPQPTRRKTVLPAAELYKQYQLGVSYTELSKKFHYHSETIKKSIMDYCEKNNLPFYKKTPNQNIEMRIHQLYEMYQSGDSYQKLEKIFNCSYRTIFRKLHQYSEEHNLPLRGREKTPFSNLKNSNIASPTSLSSNEQIAIPNLEYNTKRKELLSQLKELLQMSKNMNLENNDIVEKLVKCKTRK